MNQNYYYLLVWILSWSLGWAGLYLIAEKKRDYVKNFLVVSLYFCFVSFIMLYLFRDLLEPLVYKITFLPLALLLLFFIFNFLAYFFSNRFLKKPIKFLEKYSNVSYLSLDYRYLVSKSFEIFFQQILIVSLVFILKKQGLELGFITFIFAIMFGFGHLPMIKLQKDLFGIFIFIAAIFSSFLFPYLILTFKYGFIYTYIAHWFFYTNSGVLSWVANSDYFQSYIHNTAKKGKEILNQETGKK